MASITAQTPTVTQAPQTATDFAGLAALRSRAAADAGGVTPEAARQFEALFVQMMLKSMRDAGDVFGDGSDATYRDMFDQQIALEMTKSRGLGLAEVLTRQLAPATAAPAGPVREPGARDFVTARQAAPSPLPALPVTMTTPDPAGLQQAASLPALDFGVVAESTRPATGQSWSNWSPATPEEFIRDLWPHAQSAGAELGVDPRAIVAQAALETGWGRKVARDSRGASGNSPFNIKADARWGGERVSVRTLEFEDGLPKQKIAAFRAYPDLQAAFADYVRFLKGNPRYSEALRNGAQAGNFADALQAAGYATDPDYAGKLRSILGSPRLNDLVGQLKNLVRLPTL